MMEMYFKDSGLLLVESLTQAEIEARPEYDPAVHGISNTGQTWSPSRVPRREVWFFFPNRNKYYQSTRRKHALLAAAQEIIGNGRWQEIQDALEELGPLSDYLHSLDLATLKRKVLRAEALGLITTAERQALAQLLP